MQRHVGMFYLHFDQLWRLYIALLIGRALVHCRCTGRLLVLNTTIRFEQNAQQEKLTGRRCGRTLSFSFSFMVLPDPISVALKFWRVWAASRIHFNALVAAFAFSTASLCIICARRSTFCIICWSGMRSGCWSACALGGCWTAGALGGCLWSIYLVLNKTHKKTENLPDDGAAKRSG